MISLLNVECKFCKTLDSFTTRSNTPSVDTLAQRAGWRKTIRGWLCPSCRLDAPAPIGVCPVCCELLYRPDFSTHIIRQHPEHGIALTEESEAEREILKTL